RPLPGACSWPEHGLREVGVGVQLGRGRADKAPAVSGLRVGAVQHEEVREVGNRRAKVRASIIVVPGLADASTRSPAYLDRGQKADHIKAGRADDHIYLVLRSGARHYPVCPDLLDGLGDE